MADRPEMFGHTRGFSGMADSMEPCKMLWGPTLVAMATKFGLGAEIQSPTSLFYSFSLLQCLSNYLSFWTLVLYTKYYIVRLETIETKLNCEL